MLWRSPGYRWGGGAGGGGQRSDRRARRTYNDKQDRSVAKHDRSWMSWRGGGRRRRRRRGGGASLRCVLHTQNVLRQMWRAVRGGMLPRHKLSSNIDFLFRCLCRTDLEDCTSSSDILPQLLTNYSRDGDIDGNMGLPPPQWAGGGGGPIDRATPYRLDQASEHSTPGIRTLSTLR